MLHTSFLQLLTTLTCFCCFLDSCKNAFAPDESGCEFDYVVNCAGETKPGQTDPVYKEGILKLSSLCANAAAQHQIKHYVELSAGTVASSDKVQNKFLYLIACLKFQIMQQV